MRPMQRALVGISVDPVPPGLVGTFENQTSSCLTETITPKTLLLRLFKEASAGAVGAPTLLAFKMSDDIERFESSWTRCTTIGTVSVCPVAPESCDAARVVNVSAARAWRAAQDATRMSVSDDATLGMPVLRPSQVRFLGLGIVAIELTLTAVGTGSVSVAAWGGGDVPYCRVCVARRSPWSCHATHGATGTQPEIATKWQSAARASSTASSMLLLRLQRARRVGFYP